MQCTAKEHREAEGHRSFSPKRNHRKKMCGKSQAAGAQSPEAVYRSVSFCKKLWKLDPEKLISKPNSKV